MGRVIDLRDCFPNLEEYHHLHDGLVAFFNGASVIGIKSVFIYGSYSRGEAVPGWSDMDVMVILNDRIVSGNIADKLAAANEELSRKHNIQMTFKVHTSDEIPSYERRDGSINSYFLKAHAETGIPIAGVPPDVLLRPLIERFSVDEQKEFLKNRVQVERHKLRSVLTSINNHHLFEFTHHLPPALLTQTGHTYQVYRVARCIDAVLDVAMYVNGLLGCHTVYKEDICSFFESNMYGAHLDVSLPRYCNDVRKRWGLFDLDELTKCEQRSRLFVEAMPDALR